MTDAKGRKNLKDSRGLYLGTMTAFKKPKKDHSAKITGKMV